MRAFERRAIKSGVLVLAAGFALAGALYTAPRRWQAPIYLSADHYENPADGMAVFQVTASLPLSLRAKLLKPDLQLRLESGRESVRVIDKVQSERTVHLKLQTTTRPGTITVRALANGFDGAALALQTFRTLEDLDGDGLPDVMKLTSHDDQQSFRRWFALIAESQYYQESPVWDDQQKDCSGLVRLAWREALRPHHAGWFARVQPKIQIAAPDVSQYHYPLTPLGDQLFRTKPGRFMAADLNDDTFSNFADAQTLKSYNTVFVGKAPAPAKKGDLLFYYQPETRQFPYHLMIFLGDALIDSGGRNDWVVYHTGPSDGTPGMIKKVTLEMLRQHPSQRWWPAPDNPNFLGFYRLRILD